MVLFNTQTVPVKFQNSNGVAQRDQKSKTCIIFRKNEFKQLTIISWQQQNMKRDLLSHAQNWSHAKITTENIQVYNKQL